MWCERYEQAVQLPLSPPSAFPIKGRERNTCLPGSSVGLGMWQGWGCLTLVSTKGKSVFSGPLNLTCKGWHGWLCYTNCHLNCLLPCTTWMTTFCCSARLSKADTLLSLPTLGLRGVNMSINDYRTGSAACSSNKDTQNSVYSLTSVVWGGSKELFTSLVLLLASACECVCTRTSIQMTY